MDSKAKNGNRRAEFEICTDCGEVSYYKRGVCPECGSREFATTVSGNGRVSTTTTVHVTPEGVDQPLHLGLISFQDGVDVIARLADPELQTGDRVVLRSTSTSGTSMMNAARRVEAVAYE